MQVCYYGVPLSTMKTYVSSWLSSSDSWSSSHCLLQFIKENMSLTTRAEIQQKIADQFRAIYKSFEQEVTVMKRKNQRCAQSGTSCNWVPAAPLRHTISENAFSLCYGGVLLAPTYRQGLVAQTDSRDKNIQTIGSQNIHTIRVPAVSKGQARSMSSSSHYGARTLKSKQSVRSGYSNVATVPPQTAAATVRSGSSNVAILPPRAADASGGGRSDGNGGNVITKLSILSELYWEYGKSLCKSKLSLTDMPGCLTSFLNHSFQEICEQVETSLSDALPNSKKDKMLTILGGNEKHFQMYLVKLLRCRFSLTRHEFLLGNTANPLIVPQDDLLIWLKGFGE